MCLTFERYHRAISVSDLTRYLTQKLAYESNGPETRSPRWNVINMRELNFYIYKKNREKQTSWMDYFFFFFCKSPAKKVLCENICAPASNLLLAIRRWAVSCKHAKRRCGLTTPTPFSGNLQKYSIDKILWTRYLNRWRTKLNNAARLLSETISNRLNLINPSYNLARKRV